MYRSLVVVVVASFTLAACQASSPWQFEGKIPLESTSLTYRG